MSASTVHLISRIKPLKISTLPASVVVRPAPGTAVHRASKPSVVDILAARQEGSGQGPSNLRIEEFRNERKDWTGVKEETRKDLLKVLREK